MILTQLTIKSLIKKCVISLPKSYNFFEQDLGPSANWLLTGLLDHEFWTSFSPPVKSRVHQIGWHSTKRLLVFTGVQGSLPQPAPQAGWAGNHRGEMQPIWAREMFRDSPLSLSFPGTHCPSQATPARTQGWRDAARSPSAGKGSSPFFPSSRKSSSPKT